MPIDTADDLVDEARRHLNDGDTGIEPRRLWPSGLDEPKGRIAPARQARWGRALSRLGDGGWDTAVERSLVDGRPLPEEVIRAAAAVLKRWDWERRPTWICPVPSRRHEATIDRLCAGLSQLGKLPVHRALVRDDDTPAAYQSEQANSAHQVANVWGRLRVDEDALPARPVLDGPVLLVDDECASRWTLTVAAFLLTDPDLRGGGAGGVLPFALRAR